MGKHHTEKGSIDFASVPGASMAEKGPLGRGTKQVGILELVLLVPHCVVLGSEAI